MLRLFCIALLPVLQISAKEIEKKTADPWAPWVETNFPFYSSILDLRDVTGSNTIPWNITPRGIVLNLGHDLWACFDTELLRMSAIWSGNGVTKDALAQLSYQKDKKTESGEGKLPKPDGEIWMANGMYPGWQTGAAPTLTDPREPQPSKEEAGRGPLAENVGRFKAVWLAGDGVMLEYTVAGSLVQEWITASSVNETVQRNFRVAQSMQPLVLIAGLKSSGSCALSSGEESAARLLVDEHVWAVTVAAHEKPVVFAISCSDRRTNVHRTDPVVVPEQKPATARWPQELTTKATLSTSTAAYVVDDIALPIENPWRRNVRLADIAFFADGSAAGVTLDGDVWIIRGLGGDLDAVKWRRFASGLHEPMGIAIREGEVFVFDRNGIWRLRDTDGNGEADVHELFCNLFTQSAETREFPNSFKLAPDGSFVLSKGGQQESTISKLNGSVLRVAPDGRSFTALGVGFRQPFIGVHPRTGLVTASDQEGHYVPSTPLYIVRDGEYHGFLSPLLPKEEYPAPIADPLTWIPHAVNPSAMTQVWLTGAKMGPLNGELIHIAFNKPGVFRVLMNSRCAKPQASVVNVTESFGFPTQNGAVNPTDGQLYLAGFQVVGWGTTVNRIAGLGRVRYTGAPVTLPREVVPMDKGVLLRFDVSLDANAVTNPANYSFASWHYVRTHKYGSPQLKADGTPGQDWLTASSAYLSRDGRSVFIGVPDMKPVMQLSIGWSLTMTNGSRFEGNAYTTPYELAKFDPRAEGFDEIAVNLTPRATAAQTQGPVTVEEGRRIAQMFACIACHSVDGADLVHIGPTWKGLFGSKISYVSPGDHKQKGSVIVDESYLRESIINPSAKVVAGFEKFEAGMPIYNGVLSDSQIQSVILYIKSLK